MSRTYVTRSPRPVVLTETGGRTYVAGLVVVTETSSSIGPTPPTPGSVAPSISGEVGIIEQKLFVSVSIRMV